MNCVCVRLACALIFLAPSLVATKHLLVSDFSTLVEASGFWTCILLIALIDKCAKYFPVHFSAYRECFHTRVIFRSYANWSTDSNCVPNIIATQQDGCCYPINQIHCIMNFSNDTEPIFLGRWMQLKGHHSKVRTPPNEYWQTSFPSPDSTDWPAQCAPRVV
jgi:hypothetical protein